jgi:hypothetical protein
MPKECVVCGEELNGHGNKRYCSEACRDAKNGKAPLEMPPDAPTQDVSWNEPDTPTFCPLTRKDCMAEKCSWWLGDHEVCAMWAIGDTMHPRD